MDLTTQEAATRLKLSTRKVQQLYTEGRFPHAYKLDPAKSNSPVRIPEQDLINYEQSRRDASKSVQSN